MVFNLFDSVTHFFERPTDINMCAHLLNTKPIKKELTDGLFSFLKFLVVD